MYVTESPPPSAELVVYFLNYRFLNNMGRITIFIGFVSLPRKSLQSTDHFQVRVAYRKRKKKAAKRRRTKVFTGKQAMRFSI